MLPLPRCCGCLALACVLMRSALCAQPEAPPRTGGDAVQPAQASAASKLGLLTKMLAGDAMANRVSASGNPLAQEKFQQARTAHQRAIALHESGDDAGAESSANDALRWLREALKAADNRAVDSDRQQADYQARRERVLAFRDAYVRIQAEKSRARGGVLDEEQLQSLVSQAESLARQGRHAEGSQLLSQAGALLEAALTRLRDKETLVHELKFASVEEELQYERNRNQSYALLLDLVVSEKRTAGLKELVQKAMAENTAARTRADEVARAEDARAALKILEGATAALAQTLRAAGVPVP